jgi:hypothetical protein
MRELCILKLLQNFWDTLYLSDFPVGFPDFAGADA